MQEIIRTLSWTFFHSLWQGLLAALLAAIIIGSTRRSTARLRYNLLGILMILFFAASVITFIIQWQNASETATAASLTITSETEVTQHTAGLMDNFIAWVNTNSDAIIGLWSFFFLLSCLRLVTGLAGVNRLRHYKIHPVSIEWKDKLEKLRKLIGVQRSISLLQSELVKIPMALGILKPVILLPLGLLTHLPAEQVETILLHELAHIRRRDYLVNLLQHFAEAIFFFNPPLRWLSSLLRQEREACCDDMVIAGCNQKVNYFNALINFQEYSIKQRSYAMGISFKRHYLLNRVKRMITNKNKGISLFEKMALLTGVLLFSAFSIATRKKEEVKTTPALMEKRLAEVLPPVLTKHEQSPGRKEKKILNRLNITVVDTMPVKKDTLTRVNNVIGNKPPPTIKNPEQSAADAALQEIIDIKNQIGLRKESIGEKKEQLKTSDEKEKEKIQDEIDRERKEIESKRKVLETKRADWERLKKEAQNKPKEEKNAPLKTISDNGKSATIQNDNKRRIFGQKNKGNIFGKNNRGNIFRQNNRSISNDLNEIDFKIDSNNPGKQGFQYQLDLQVNNPPPAPDQKIAPEKPKIRGRTCDESQAVRL